MKFVSFLHLSAVAMLGATACDPTDGTVDPSKPQAGYVTGKATDAQGNPLANVKVYIDNSVYFNSGISTTTDAQGNYKVKAQPGAYKAYAQLMHTYHGEQFKIDLHPSSNNSFGEEGAVRDFTWKLTGPKAINPSTTYGGTIRINPDPISVIFDRQNVVFTLVPDGPLIDGSAGKTLTLQCGEPGSTTYAKLTDVPIGRYTVTAIYKPTGRRVRLRKQYTDPIKDKLTVTFYGEDSPINCSECANIDFLH